MVNAGGISFPEPSHIGSIVYGRSSSANSRYQPEFMNSCDCWGFRDSVVDNSLTRRSAFTKCQQTAERCGADERPIEKNKENSIPAWRHPFAVPCCGANIYSAVCRTYRLGRWLICRRSLKCKQSGNEDAASYIVRERHIGRRRRTVGVVLLIFASAATASAAVLRIIIWIVEFSSPIA